MVDRRRKVGSENTKNWIALAALLWGIGYALWNEWGKWKAGKAMETKRKELEAKVDGWIDATGKWMNTTEDEARRTTAIMQANEELKKDTWRIATGKVNDVFFEKLTKILKAKTPDNMILSEYLRKLRDEASFKIKQAPSEIILLLEEAVIEPVIECERKYGGGKYTPAVAFEELGAVVAENLVKMCEAKKIKFP